MRAVFLFFLFLSAAAHAEWDHLFSDDEDPALFHHVNVISGNLNLCLQDGVVQGAKSIPLFRTYSSSGALEREEGADKYLRDKRGLLIQGGWSFFPHTNLFIVVPEKLSKMEAYLPERSGNYIKYSHPRKGEKSGDRILAPKIEAGQCAGTLSARNNPTNNRLVVNLWHGTATLLLPDGGTRVYEGEKLGSEDYSRRFYYRLVSEKLPSGHTLHYDYDEKDQLYHIWMKNQSGSKVFAWAHINLYRKKPPFHFQVTTSDGKNFEYQALEFKMRDYLSHVRSNWKSEEKAHYAPGRKGTGARIERIERNGQSQLKVSYYLPPDAKSEKKWWNNPEKKGVLADKVSMLEAPFGPNGEMQRIAHFSYAKEYTDVRDVDGILTRYLHDGHKLKEIQNFDNRASVYSSTRFLWEEDRLRSKVKLDATGAPVLAKIFKYDLTGNVIEETLWGNLTGQAQNCFALGENYSLSGAESVTKTFRYNHLNLPVLEVEEEGHTTSFDYKPGTDLLTLKLTYLQEKIVKREIFEYDADNLLVAEIVDDGYSPDPHDLSGISTRKIKRYTLDSHSGLTKEIKESYYDAEKRVEMQIKRVEYTYSQENLVTQERVYDATDTYRYTLVTDYEKGRVIKKTTPLGNENIYRYDTHGNLIESKEVGAPRRIYSCDAVGRPLSCTEKWRDGTEKISFSEYDAKGRLLKQIDTKGNATEQIYDEFGRCLRTEFPAARDENGESYTPTANFTYDGEGNLASSSTSSGERTETLYNAFRKPIKITHADGTSLHHLYTKSATLAQTVYPDGTEIHYAYDTFQRMTEKKVLSPLKEVLSSEKWEYSTFHLLTHTDVRGLTTHYTYDGAGRKIAEEAEGRKKTFVYDALGFLEREIEGEVSHVQVCDVEGHIIEEWTEEANGRTENWMRFFYDSEGRKERAIRLTSQGDAIDLFSQDDNGRLTKHTDPEGHETHFRYEEDEKNDLGQHVEKKITIDALGNTTIETSDGMSRPLMLEKKDPQGKIVSREEYSYDRSGNRVSRTTSVFQKNTLVKQISSSWDYDLMGRIIKEVEDGEKVTTLSYDQRGRVKTRTLPDGTILSYTYDGLDRLTEMTSSDGTIHLIYSYARGPEPRQISDLVQKTTLTRNYNLFGELTEECNSCGLRYKWEHDDLGRVTRFTLPDHSSIAYTYQGNHLISVARNTMSGEQLYSHEYTHFDENGNVHEEMFINRTCAARTKRDLLERPVAFSSLPLQHKVAYGPTGLVIETKNSLFGEKKYSYDPLNQLEQEGSIAHNFDSIGNPISCETGSCNQISSFKGYSLRYDPCGNPRERTRTHEQILYTYDALSRLTSITYPKTKKIDYQYDPLSRLLSKKISIYKNGIFQEQPAIYYLYNQEQEIGTVDEKGKICELKVLGLSIRGEIGAAVAIEIQGKAYAPLHDFQDNILALLSPDGEIIESYEISAFGQEKSASIPLNPWRFSSKRAEEGLIFFGLRFYDPALGRWLTPDPAGFADGPNLYLFVLNSPLNRLDLFGLLSESRFPEQKPPYLTEINVPMNRVLPPPSPQTLIQAQGRVGKIMVDWVVSCGHWHKLQFTSEEHKTGTVNIVNHFHELVPKDGMTVGLITAINGIHTDLNTFTNSMSRSIVTKVPEGTLFVGIHLPTEGFFRDFERAGSEIADRETAAICMASQTLGAFAEKLHKYNPQGLWLHIAHSRGGVTTRRAIERLPPETKALLQQQLYIYALAPAMVIPRECGVRVNNVYSMEDKVTGWAGLFPQFKKTKYDITYIPSRLNLLDRLMFRSEHGIMQKTYDTALKNELSLIRGKYGFYNDAMR